MQCGDCCENIHVGLSMAGWEREYSIRFHRMGWNPRFVGPEADADADAYVREAEFITRFWREVGPVPEGELDPAYGPKWRFMCTMFNVEQRTCMAQENKPLVCSEYPWYGKAPRAAIRSNRCSYWADVPREEWPEGVIPLTEVYCA